MTGNCNEDLYFLTIVYIKAILLWGQGNIFKLYFTINIYTVSFVAIKLHSDCLSFILYTWKLCQKQCTLICGIPICYSCIQQMKSNALGCHHHDVKTFCCVFLLMRHIDPEVSEMILLSSSCHHKQIHVTQGGI